jgi:hypothetical protein
MRIETDITRMTGQAFSSITDMVAWSSAARAETNPAQSLA